MVHVHGRAVAERVTAGAPLRERIAVPVDVGKHSAMAMVADFAGERLVAPFTFSLDRSGLGELVARVERVVAARAVRSVEVGVESAAHYHRPLTASGLLPADWRLIELNPAHVTQQRRVLGKRGGKTDQVDLAATSTVCGRVSWPCASSARGWRPGTALVSGRDAPEPHRRPCLQLQQRVSRRPAGWPRPATSRSYISSA